MTLDEDKARELLHMAAATIDVHDVGPELPEATTSRRVRWLPQVVAAAAVVAIASVGVVWITGANNDPEHVPSGSPTETVPQTGSPSPLDPSGLTDEEIAAAFVAFAKNGNSELPWAENVTYFVGGTEVVDLDANQARRSQAWEGCPDGMATYQERSCPVSPLRTLAELLQDARPVFETRVPKTVGCSLGGSPQGVAGASSISIRPDETRRDCFSDFAITLFIDESARVTAVDFILSGP